MFSADNLYLEEVRGPKAFFGVGLGNVKYPIGKFSSEFIEPVIIEKRKKLFHLSWNDLNILNKRIISAKIYGDLLHPYDYTETDLLIVRDIFDKQIVDANGAKVVRVNDVKLEGFDSAAILVAVDVGMRGIMRRLGFERGGEDMMRLFKKHLPYNLISWNYIQPLEAKLTKISLTVPRQMVFRETGVPG